MSIEKGKITGLQLTFLVTGFVQGSILLVPFVSGMTKHDTWIAILSASAAIIPFGLCYAALSKRFPGINLVQINDIVYGRYIGKAISLLYIYYLLNILSFNIRNIGDMYTTFLMPETPTIFFLIVITATCAYALLRGIEVIARISHLLVVIIFIVIISTFLLLLENMDFSNFLPIFDVPIKKFIFGTFFVFSVPFGEAVIFLTIIPSLNNNKHLTRNITIGLILGAISLFIVAIRNTAALGNTETMLSSSSFQSIRLIDIGNVFTRMDLLIGIAQTMLIFLKSTVFYYATVICLSQLFRLKTYLPLVLPVGGSAVILAATAWKSSAEVYRLVNSSAIIFQSLFTLFFPALSLLIAKLRNLRKQRGDDGK